MEIAPSECVTCFDALSLSALGWLSLYRRASATSGRLLPFLLYPFYSDRPSTDYQTASLRHLSLISPSL